MTDFGSIGTAGTYSAPISGGTAIAATAASEAFEEQPVSSAGTFSSFYVRIIVGTANAYQVAITLFKNGSATSITCSTGTTAASIGAAATCSDTTHTVSVVAGDSLAYVVQPNASNSNNRVGVAIHLQ
jgi:hypothetical protein